MSTKFARERKSNIKKNISRLSDSRRPKVYSLTWRPKKIDELKSKWDTEVGLESFLRFGKN